MKPVLGACAFACVLVRCAGPVEPPTPPSSLSAHDLRVPDNQPFAEPSIEDVDAAAPDTYSFICELQSPPPLTAVAPFWYPPRPPPIGAGPFRSSAGFANPEYLLAFVEGGWGGAAWVCVGGATTSGGRLDGYPAPPPAFFALPAAFAAIAAAICASAAAASAAFLCAAFRASRARSSFSALRLRRSAFSFSFSFSLRFCSSLTRSIAPRPPLTFLLRSPSSSSSELDASQSFFFDRLRLGSSSSSSSLSDVFFFSLERPGGATGPSPNGLTLAMPPPPPGIEPAARSSPEPSDPLGPFSAEPVVAALPIFGYGGSGGGGSPDMAATTCARSSSDIFFRWYVLSSCLSSCFKNLTHALGWRPMRNCPGAAPRGGFGDGGRHPSSSSGT